MKEHPLDKKDVGIIPLHDAICGPICSVFLSALRKKNQYHDIKCLFEKVNKIDGENYTEIICVKHLTVNKHD